MKGAVAWSKDLPHLVDPDFRAVSGWPPHYWKIDAGKLAVMSDSERKARDNHIATYGAYNETPRPRAPSIWPQLLLAFSAGCAISATVFLYLR